MIIPPLRRSHRSREFKRYSDEEKARVVYLYLAEGKPHRELDEEVLGLDRNVSKGFQSMNILHYLGLRNEFSDFFHGMTPGEIIGLFIEGSDEDCWEIIQLLYLYRKMGEKESKQGSYTQLRLPGMDPFRIQKQPVLGYAVSQFLTKTGWSVTIGHPSLSCVDRIA